jgi:hypothetical protein
LTARQNPAGALPKSLCHNVAGIAARLAVLPTNLLNSPVKFADHLPFI